jgi:hypothetical protein
VVAVEQTLQVAQVVRVAAARVRQEILQMHQHQVLLTLEVVVAETADIALQIGLGKVALAS